MSQSLGNTRPTVHDVARVAGVSIATVSRVLNGLGASASSTTKVNTAVKELGYVPNQFAQSLKNQRAGQITFAAEDVGNPAYLAMMRAIEPQLQEHGIRLLLQSTGARASEEARAIRELDSDFVDGIILCPIRMTDELAAAISATTTPIVVIGALPEGLQVDNVRVDSAAGAALAVRHLVALGNNRIAFLTGPLDTHPGRSRMRGYRQALDEAGIGFDPALIREATSFRFDGGLPLARDLVQNVQFDALLGASDALAIAGVHALHEWRAPQRHVVGMDDADMARMAMPSLTSVNLGASERGALAARLLLERIADPTLPPRTETVAPFITVRDSTR